jgi:hypothetical protein
MSLPKQFGVVPVHSSETSEDASVDTPLTASIDVSTEPSMPPSPEGPIAASTPPSERPKPESDPASALASLPDAEPDIVPELASEAPLDAFADPLADEVSDVPEDAGMLLDPQAAIGPQVSVVATRISSSLPFAHFRMHPSACIAEHIPCRQPRPCEWLRRSGASEGNFRFQPRLRRMSRVVHGATRTKLVMTWRSRLARTARLNRPSSAKARSLVLAWPLLVNNDR